MDTRAKIVSPEESASRLKPGTLVVAGHFDPLLASHAARLAEARAGAAALAVVVTDPPEPVLPLRARAELVAALRCVDLVIPGGPGAPTPDLNWESEHLHAAADFLQHVKSRQA